MMPEQEAYAILDTEYPRIGPCGLCGAPGSDQRHRVLDAIAERARAGERLQEVAEDYGVSMDVVMAAITYEAMGRMD